MAMQPGPRNVFPMHMTRISFGKVNRWLYVRNGGSNPDEPAMQTEFQDKDGVVLEGLAQPGFTLQGAFHEPPPDHPGAFEEPHTITAGDLLQEETTTDIPPKTMNVWRTWENIFIGGSSSMYINVKPLPSIFRLKCIWIDPGTPGLSRFGLTVGIAKVGTINPGAIVPTDFSTMFPPGSFNGLLLGEGDPAVPVATFKIDKSKGTVTIL